MVMEKSSGRFALISATAVLLTLAALLAVTPAAAVTTYWQLAPDPSVFGGDWHEPGNWTAGVPDSVTDAIIDNGGTAIIRSNNAEALTLTVGDANRGEVLVNFQETLILSTLILGNQAGSWGRWGDSELSFGPLTVGQPGAPANMIVGRGGTGSFELSGGLTAHGDVIVGDQPGSSGSFNSFYFDTASIAGDFILGNQAGAAGSSRIRNGAITVGGDMVVGSAGTGEVLTGSILGIGLGLDLTVNGNLIIGDQPGSQGSIGSFDHGDRFHIKGDLILGKQAGSSGSLGTSGIVTVGDAGAPANLIVGAGGNGLFEVGFEPPSTVTVHGNLIAGDQTGSVGRVGFGHGQAQVKGDFTLGNQAGSSGESYIDGGSLTVGEAGAPANLIVGAGGEGLFTQDTGTVTVHDRLVLGRDAGSQGTYRLYGSFDPFSSTRLSAAEIIVGGEGRGEFHLDNAVEVNVSRSLTFGENSHFSAEPGATITMTGADFDNRSPAPGNLSGLANLKLVFAGGPDTEDRFEVAGLDLGPVLAGFFDNFALGTLQVGDDTHTGYVGLYDLFDNSPGNENEALYVYALILGLGSTLDLHYLPLYAQSFTNLGGSIMNGQIHVVPWPGSWLLLSTGLLGLGVMGWRRKRS